MPFNMVCFRLAIKSAIASMQERNPIKPKIMTTMLLHLLASLQFM